MKRNTLRAVLALALMTLLLTGCTAADGQIERGALQSGTYDAAGAVKIELDALSGARCTIDSAGTYVLSGRYQGQLVIDAGDGDVRLVLNGAEIACAQGPAVYVLSAGRVAIVTALDSQNLLSDGTSYEKDAEGADGAVYAKDDLDFDGEGTLTIQGNTAHGVVCKDELRVLGGTVNVTAVSDGLRGKDGVTVSGGMLSITAGSDAIQATGTDQAQGAVTISGGMLTLRAERDGIQAAGSLTVSGGMIDIKTGEGSASAAVRSDAGGFGGRGFGGRGRQTQDAASSDTQTGSSQKGLKAGGALVLSGGSLTLDTVDDALHASGDITIENGVLTLSAGDDAIHSDANVLIKNGTIKVLTCYEGVEGLTVTVDGGMLDITAYDDGINAAGGADSSGYQGFGWGRDQFAATDGCYVVINGGSITVVSDGDCIDSNGDLTLNGGTLTLSCSGNGNTALDCSGSYAKNGGSVTTNDGSENGASFPGGGRNNGFGGGKHR